MAELTENELKITQLLDRIEAINKLIVNHQSTNDTLYKQHIEQRLKHIADLNQLLDVYGISVSALEEVNDVENA